MRIPSPTTALARALVRAGLTFAFAAGALGIAGACATPAAAHDSATQKPTPVVAILLSPYLSFSDLSPDATPALWSLAENGAVGSMNAISADPRWPTVAGGALTLSAGRWASAEASAPADAASLEDQRAANAGSLAKPQLGALGDAIHAAGGLTAAVGTSDQGVGPTVMALRPAELVATDSRGSIDFVATGSDLLVAAPDAPFGVRTDAARLESAISSAVATVQDGPRPGLLVVDTGDLSRAHAASGPAAEAGGSARDHAAAVASLDAAAAALARDLPPGSLLLVVTPTTDKPYYEPPYFGPVIASGDGLSGVLRSSSTHRTGLVTNLDIAPTVLAALGVSAPDTMIGSPISARPDSTPLAEKLAALARTGRAAGAVDKLRDLYFTPAFAWFAVLCVVAAVLAAFAPALRIRTVSRWLVLLVLSAPPAAWTALLIARSPESPGAAAVAFGIAWLAVFVAALTVARLVGGEAALACLAADTALLILIDQWVGGPLQSGLFSYSVRAGWRYYGIGNEGSALAVAAALAAIGLTCDIASRTRWALLLRRYAIPVVGAVVLVTAAAPFAGANAGVAVWGVVAFAVAWLRLNDVRFTVRTVAWTVAVVALVVAAIAAVDLLGGGGGTHIGRFFLEFAHGGGGAWELVRRKALNNLGYLTQTPYTWLALALASALAIERWVRPRPLESALSRHPGYAATLVGVIVGSIVALLTEDSGIVMPALMLLAGGLPALYLALAASPTTAGNFGADDSGAQESAS